jgi:hypothetical protein
MICVDSFVWIDYFIGQRTWQTNLLDILLSDVPIIIGDLILAEILLDFDQIITMNQQNPS